LSRVIPGEKFKFVYEYDFGDGWGHTILVEKIFRPENELKAPVCLDGKRSAPPGDCGGKGGYHDVLKALKTRTIRIVRNCWSGWVNTIPSISTLMR
jgi:hypothetical protein